MSWLGVDSGAFDADGSPIGSGDASGRNADAPPPPFEATDMKGFRVETWLLEVSILAWYEYAHDCNACYDTVENVICIQ